MTLRIGRWPPFAMVFSLTPRPANPVGCADLLLRTVDGSTVFARVYYPARPAGWLTSLLWRSHASAPAWLPHPRSLDGFLSFVASNLDTGLRKRPQGPVVSFLRKALTMAAGAVHYLLTRLPAVWHAQPALGAQLPVVLFSHGLGGNRNAYSGHSIDLAQHGSLVVCVEHSDGTSSLTPHSHDDSGRPGAWRYYAGVGLPGERHPRVAHRVDELTALADVFTALAAGSQLPHSPHLLGGSQWLLHQLSGRVDVSRLAVVGHSAGGVTALAFARRDSRVHCCVVHDPWLPAIVGAPPSLVLGAAPWNHRCAVLVMLCEAWMVNGNHNPDLLRGTLASIRAAGGVAECAGLKGCDHHVFSDVPLLAPGSRRTAALQAQQRIFAAAQKWLAADETKLNSGGADAVRAALGPTLFLPIDVPHGEKPPRG